MRVLRILFGLILEYILIVRKWVEQITNTTKPAKWQRGEKGDVLLIPGFRETWVFQKTIAEFLNSKGYRIHTISSLEPNVYPIEFCVNTVRGYIVKNNLKNLILLAHSKGGIIANLLLQDKNIKKRILCAFTVAVPYKGTIWGYGIFQNLLELSPSSKVLQKMKGSSKIINLYPLYDNHVLPNKNLLLPGAINIQIPIVGHTRILESKETTKTIEKYLND